MPLFLYGEYEKAPFLWRYDRGLPSPFSICVMSTRLMLHFPCTLLISGCLERSGSGQAEDKRGSAKNRNSSQTLQHCKISATLSSPRLQARAFYFQT
jgi:hypothetical protein